MKFHNLRDPLNLPGIPDDREGLFDTIARSKNHHQKRAYQCIKCMVTLFVSCPAAANMLQSNGDLKRKWSSAVEWLNDELERVSVCFLVLLKSLGYFLFYSVFRVATQPVIVREFENFQG